MDALVDSIRQLSRLGIMTVPYEENPVTQMLKANRAADLSG